jgi:hypothetical protein
MMAVVCQREQPGPCKCLFAVMLKLAEAKALYNLFQLLKAVTRLTQNLLKMLQTPRITSCNCTPKEENLISLQTNAVLRK